jgi:hypothetical protein
MNTKAFKTVLILVFAHDYVANIYVSPFVQLCIFYDLAMNSGGMMKIKRGIKFEERVGG